MINIATLLKDAPKGMKLYSPLFGEVKFVGIDKRSGYPIDVIDCKKNGKSFTEFGVYFADHPDAECLLFPSKVVRTWEGWKPSAEPKFKAEDRIVSKSDKSTIYRIICLHEERREYIVEIEHKDYHESCPWIAFEDQDDFELAPKKHYAIANFKPIQWVLVRNYDNQVWGLSMFSHRDMGCYICLNREDFTQCIPFEGNEHLLGTSDPCDKQYINW